MNTRLIRSLKEQATDLGLIRGWHKFSVPASIIVFAALVGPEGAGAQMYNSYSGGRSSAGTQSNRYAGAATANIDKSAISANRDMLHNDINYENFTLQKRKAFFNQMKASEEKDEKFRTYAEQRLENLAANKTLTAPQQNEARGLINWLQKDASQRANNEAWLKRQDQTLALLEQDQFVSLKNERNGIHNLMEDNILVRDQYKWNQQMQIAQLDLQQNQQGGFLWGRPYAGYYGSAYGRYGYGPFGYGGGARWGRGYRWGY